VKDVKGVKRSTRAEADADLVLDGDESLLDVVDHVLTKGVVVTGDLVLGVADVDLVYLRLSAVLCAADRILGPRPREAKRAQRDVADVGGVLGRVAPKRALARRLGKRR
jgi:hypothetical protein